MRYTYSDDEDDGSDALSSRRSTRQSGVSTPAELTGPTVTASGRQVRSRLHGMYGESILVDQRKEIENERALPASSELEDDGEMAGTDGRPRRTTRQGRPSRKQEVYGDDDGLGDESEVDSADDGWSGYEDEPDEAEIEPDVDEDDEDDEVSADDSEVDDADIEEGPPRSLVVQLRYKKKPTVSYEANGRKGDLVLDKKELNLGGDSNALMEPVVVKPATTIADPKQNYPSNGLPHHFSPPSESKPFVNGNSSTNLQGPDEEKLPEHLLYQHPQVMQH